MAKVKVEWCEKKSEDWLVVSLIHDNQKIEDVSINRKSKKGELFPNFDNIQAGQEVEGELWQSDGGKWYLFPPRTPKTASGGAYKAKVAKDTIDYQDEKIGQRMDDKQLGIKISSTFRAAVDTSLEEYKQDPTKSIQDLFEKWRRWYWFKFEDTEGYPPFE